MSTLQKRYTAFRFSTLTWALRFAFLTTTLVPGLLLGLLILLGSSIAPELAPSKLLTEATSYLQSLGSPSAQGRVKSEQCKGFSSSMQLEADQSLLPSVTCSEWETVELSQEEFASLARRAMGVIYILFLLPSAMFVLGTGLATRRSHSGPGHDVAQHWQDTNHNLMPQARGEKHLVGQQTFEYSKAKADQFGFYVSDGQQTRRAAGKPDWAPLALTMSAINSIPQGFYVLEALLDAYDLPHDAPQAIDWLSANERSFWIAREALERQYDTYRATTAATTPMEARGYTGLSPVEAAHEFSQAYQMCHPRRTVLFLCASDERIAYHESGLVKSARESAKKLFDSSVLWVADLFEGSGLQVDRDNMLVKLPGYQPLYLSTSNEI
ncbi:TPA: hypothetical protein ACP3ZG_000623 [Pseudomonas aeruginosa]|nr:MULTISPECIES: hypothetical protein [Pseudomonas]ELB6590168.1 hypothetical protein [Pseudomonas aeruginosa]MBI8852213.1 hypothetical protein [Pseudomonas aeruginosa]OBY57009.1 hypothetical protein A9513_015965 [Pseudomonas sp. AU12215]